MFKSYTIQDQRIVLDELHSVNIKTRRLLFSTSQSYIALKYKMSWKDDVDKLVKQIDGIVLRLPNQTTEIPS